MTEKPAGSDVATAIAFFRAAYPKPESKNFHTQLGCHFEEIAEMLETLDGTDHVTRILLERAYTGIEHLAKFLKASDGRITVKNRTGLLDALCDQLVTASGVAHMSNLDIIGGFAEVNRSNFSKFDENGQPILDINKKMTKGPNYQPPDLRRFAGES